MLKQNRNIKKKNISEITTKLATEKENNNIENENDTDYDMQIFLKMKDDFITLYNDEYVNNVQDDLLKLEIELMVEKTCQLFFEYHNQETEKKLEYEILKNNVKINVDKLVLYNKLKIKLELLQDIFEAKKNQNNKNEFNKQKNKSIFSANENEFNFFRGIVKVDRYDRLKKIFEIIMSNNKSLIEKNKTIMNSKKINKKNKLKKYKNDIPKSARKRKKKSTRENSINAKIDNNDSIIDNYKAKYNNKTMIESPSCSGKKKSYRSKYNTASEGVNIANMQ